MVALPGWFPVQSGRSIHSVDGMYAAMRRCREVRSLHAAIREEMVNEADIDRFVRGLLNHFVPGEQFAFQLSLGSIAVACAGINKAFARKFVGYLANLKSTELALASQIANQALQLIPSTILETIREDSPEYEVRFLETVPRSDAGHTVVVFDEDLVNA